jgi:hypothetical protein
MIVCPRCSSEESAVVDSRRDGDGYIRRRRSCYGCGARMTTVETLVRKNGRSHSAARAAKESLAAAVMIGELIDVRARIDALLDMVRPHVRPLLPPPVIDTVPAADDVSEAVEAQAS